MTNSLSFLPQCDRIFMIDDKTICEIGTYAELINKKGAFADFVGKNLTNENKKEKEVKNNGIFLFINSIFFLSSFNFFKYD